MAVAADDDVIMHGDTERLGNVDDRFRHADIGLRRRRVAGRVIVHEHSEAAMFFTLLAFLRNPNWLGPAIGDGSTIANRDRHA